MENKRDVNQSSNLLESRTYKNLLTAFQLDSKYSLLYSYFAQIAELEGFKHAAELFSIFSEGMICSAHGNLDFIREIYGSHLGVQVGETSENINYAIAHESKDGDEFFSIAAEIAHEEGLHDIASWMKTIAKSRKEHAKKLKNILQLLGRN